METSKTPAMPSSSTSNLFESPSSQNLGSPIIRNIPELRTSEGFQFSFNETSKEECKCSWEPSPSPKPERDLNSFSLVDELSSMQNQIKMINWKLHKNIEVLKEKEKKNNRLKEIISKHEAKSTMPTDESLLEGRCSCNDFCKIS
jgi:hypothetical protein